MVSSNSSSNKQGQGEKQKHIIVQVGDNEIISKVLLSQLKQSFEDQKANIELVSVSVEKNEDWDKFFERLLKNNPNLVMIHFPNHYEQELTNPQAQKLRELGAKYNITVSFPYLTTEEASIIERAKQYNIELPKDKDKEIKK